MTSTTTGTRGDLWGHPKGLYICFGTELVRPVLEAFHYIHCVPCAIPKAAATDVERTSPAVMR